MENFFVELCVRASVARLYCQRSLCLIAPAKAVIMNITAISLGFSKIVLIIMPVLNVFVIFVVLICTFSTDLPCVMIVFLNLI
jgi:hypothetical protein